MAELKKGVAYKLQRAFDLIIDQCLFLYLVKHLKWYLDSQATKSVFD